MLIGLCVAITLAPDSLPQRVAKRNRLLGVPTALDMVLAVFVAYAWWTGQGPMGLSLERPAVDWPILGGLLAQTGGMTTWCGTSR